MKKKLMGASQNFSRAAIQPVMFLAIMGLILAVAVIMQLDFMPAAVIFAGTLLKTMMDTMLNNLSVVFCVGLATAFARKKKVDAAVISLITYLIFLAANNAWLVSQNMLAEPGAMGLFGTGQGVVLGFQVVDMNVFLGLILGCIVGYVHNRCCETAFPEMFSIYGGSRLVFLLLIPITLVLAIILSYVWPVINGGINLLSEFMKNAGAAGVFLYAFGNRFLIPTGLHHLLWMPFCFTGLGGSLEIGGQVVQGAANIFYAEMGEAAQLTAIDSSVRFATFGFAKIFGGIGIGLAFIRMAKPEHRNAVKGMILPSVFVGAVAGITEPLDFSFLFISPFLWLVHGLITAVSETVLWVLGVRTYALYGLLDTLVCNSVISPQLTKIYLFFIVGIIMTGIWYLVFCFIIKRFDLQTPGRGSDFGLEIQEQGEPQKAGAQGYSVEDARRIIKGLGGVSNIESINNCFTRLRCEVREVNRIDQSLLKQTPQKGVVINGSNVQVIIGLNVETVKDLVKQLWKEGE